MKGRLRFFTSPKSKEGCAFVSQNRKGIVVENGTVKEWFKGTDMFGDETIEERGRYGDGVVMTNSKKTVAKRPLDIFLIDHPMVK